jgi:hypothetical protein
VSALEGVDIQQPAFVSKINNQKDRDVKPGGKGAMPSPQNGFDKPGNWGEGLNYIYDKNL